ncbi:hypothetical protein [Virgibacillus oceani]|uniref:RNA polymerase subunit sigma n=1 Tax=Virgibacillus oceani TaxID=1479511 RepID=A0A917H793_9BACI|nr:hypothetical protein [Virgibacillus oceani]GGG68838.1 hypothetical protein GCM10011398_10960 [Virgibacillus oceani]
MSWKSIEMQVALPRTQDAGKLQEQMLKHGQHIQESIAESQLKQEEQKRKRVNEFEQINDVNNRRERGNSDHPQRDNQQKSEQEEQMIEHPYLGNKIDFSG